MRPGRYRVQENENAHSHVQHPALAFNVWRALESVALRPVLDLCEAHTLRGSSNPGSKAMPSMMSQAETRPRHVAMP